MKKLILFILLFVSVSCGSIKYIPVEKKEVVNVRDSVVLRDSTVITYLTKEKIVDVVPQYDSLILETTYAKSVSYVDTLTHTLKGELTHKDTTPVKQKIVYEDRIITQEKIVKQEVPIPVEVEKKYIPKWVWVSLGCNLLILIYIVLKIKFKLFV